MTNTRYAIPFLPKSVKNTTNECNTFITMPTSPIPVERKPENGPALVPNTIVKFTFAKNERILDAIVATQNNHITAIGFMIYMEI